MDAKAQAVFERFPGLKEFNVSSAMRRHRNIDDALPPTRRPGSSPGVSTNSAVRTRRAPEGAFCKACFRLRPAQRP
jgi:hypothetical protein